MVDLIVVGGGIVGCTIAKAMSAQGMSVTVLDDRRPMAGTAPSGGHCKPSWFGGMSKQQYEPAMELLDECWGLITEEFSLFGVKSKLSTVYRVDTDQVLLHPVTSQTVLEVNRGLPAVVTNHGMIKSKHLVICAGVWTSTLLPEINITEKRGVSFRFRGVLNSPFISPWAPYKQVVAHQQSSKEIWIGDGSAILQKNWDVVRTGKCLIRCKDALNSKHLTTDLRHVITGLRPYCTTKSKEPCLLEKVGRKVWAVTGTGKMGTIAAGWAARRLIDEIC